MSQNVPPPHHQPHVDAGLGPGLGTGPGVLVPVVPGPPAATTQAHVFGVAPGQHPFGHQNLLHRAQVGQLRQDQLQLLQQALVSVPGMPAGFMAGAASAGGTLLSCPSFSQVWVLVCLVGVLPPGSSGSGSSRSTPSARPWLSSRCSTTSWSHWCGSPGTASCYGCSCWRCWSS
jgi:hypothetical protein